ncbi:hypothetical protein [Chryseobacterium rhizosphaerae]|uniref:hypothetical protein n=1 Tax=Chryseobacterium rhizosphaerae TaxID=395937 RepID=UPI00235946F2|nr:hypothetical protein [Chryseobacterium rhizosphaerae]MDC8098671.1 hypothetical protein [Chryseobacterium rhizosphaerae]
MAKRLKTKIGDIFSIPINENEKRYMQLIAYDLTQLNSDVVRIFKKKYSLQESPIVTKILQDDIYTYVHCSTDIGLKMDMWQKEENSHEIGDIESIIFRDTNDYGYNEGQDPIKISNNWSVWRINAKDFKYIGKLNGIYKNSYMGLVINPIGIVEIAKGNKYPPNYPDFE